MKPMLERTGTRVLLMGMPIVGIPLAFLLKPLAFELAKHLPRCMAYERLDIYCPGCGLTRTLLALLQCNIPLALRNNAAIVAGIVLLVLLYIQGICWSFGNRSVRLVPVKPWFWSVFGTCCAVYFVVRNFVPWMMPIKLY